MMKVNVKEAKTNLSKFLSLVETEKEDAICIARNGKPIAKIVPADNISVSDRIGIAENKFEVPDDLDAGSEEIAMLLTGGSL